MTKNERYIFDVWKGERHSYEDRRNAISDRINVMYKTNGGRQTHITLSEKIEYLVTRDEKTRHDAILALIDFTVNYIKHSERKTLAKAMENADISA